LRSVPPNRSFSDVIDQTPALRGSGAAACPVSCPSAAGAAIESIKKAARPAALIDLCPTMRSAFNRKAHARKVLVLTRAHIALMILHLAANIAERNLAKPALDRDAGLYIADGNLVAEGYIA